MKIGDIVGLNASSGKVAYRLKILELGKYKSKVKVLDSRVTSLIGKEEMWLTGVLKELWVWEELDCEPKSID